MAKEGIQIFSHVVNEGDSPTLFIGLVGSKNGEANLMHFEEIGFVSANEDGSEPVFRVTEPANLLVFLEKVGLNKLINIQKEFASDLSLALLRETLEKIKRT